MGVAPEFGFGAAISNPNLWVLEHIAIPLRIRTVRGQEVRLFLFDQKPNGNRDWIRRPHSITVALISRWLVRRYFNFSMNRNSGLGFAIVAL